jgi:DNA-directed RNA polymerase subunit RPC12/RpoP
VEGRYVTDILFQCPECEKHVAVGDAFIGTRFLCPDCSARLEAPEPRIVFSCPACHSRMAAPDPLRGEAYLCPNCGEEIDIPENTTVTCQGCGVNMELDDEYYAELEGKAIDCPECETAVAIPTRPRAPVSSTSASKLPSGFGHKTIRLDELIEGIPQAKPLEEGRCPYCANKIHQMSNQQFVCRTCGRLIKTVRPAIRRAQ